MRILRFRLHYVGRRETVAHDDPFFERFTLHLIFHFRAIVEKQECAALLSNTQSPENTKTNNSRLQSLDSVRVRPKQYYLK